MINAILITEKIIKMTEKLKRNLNITTKAGLLDVIDALPLVLTVIDENMNVILANRSAFLFSKKDESQLIGHTGGNSLGCIHHDDVPEGCGFAPDCLKCKLSKTVLETIEKNEPKHLIETTMVFKAHGKKYLRISTQPMNLNGKPVVLLAIEDITEVKQQEKILMDKEKLSAVIQTAGAICHEMNQPLMVLLGYAELLLCDMSEGDNQVSKIKEIKNQAERLGTITRKLTTITQYKTKEYINSKIIDIDTTPNINEGQVG